MLAERDARYGKAPSQRSVGLAYGHGSTAPPSCHRTILRPALHHRGHNEAGIIEAIAAAIRLASIQVDLQYGSLTSRSKKQPASGLSCPSTYLQSFAESVAPRPVSMQAGKALGTASFRFSANQAPVAPLKPRMYSLGVAHFWGVALFSSKAGARRLALMAGNEAPRIPWKEEQLFYTVMHQVGVHL